MKPCPGIQWADCPLRREVIRDMMGLLREAWSGGWNRAHDDIEDHVYLDESPTFEQWVRERLGPEWVQGGPLKPEIPGS